LHIGADANRQRITHLPSADRETSRQHRDFVRRVVKRTGKAATRIAKELGIAPSTLTRLLREPDDSTSTLHARTLRMLEEFSGLTLGSGNEPAGAPGTPGFREEAVPFDAKSADPALSAAIKALTAGRKAADAWTIKTRSLERVGFMPGDVVIVDLGMRAQAGNAVCAQVYDVRSGTAETVMRLYEPPYLLTASLDENLRRPLVVDDEQVVIKGVVLPHRLRPGVPVP
jgi:antitoxin component of RelBE/YafQ-DinJ toxin-antitoxin module